MRLIVFFFLSFLSFVIYSVFLLFLFFSSIENNEGKLILTSEMNADTYVNGQVKITDVIVYH